MGNCVQPDIRPKQHEFSLQEELSPLFPTPSPPAKKKKKNYPFNKHGLTKTPTMSYLLEKIRLNPRNPGIDINDDQIILKSDFTPTRAKVFKDIRKQLRIHGWKNIPSLNMGKLRHDDELDKLLGLSTNKIFSHLQDLKLEYRQTSRHTLFYEVFRSLPGESGLQSLTLKMERSGPKEYLKDVAKMIRRKYCTSLKHLDLDVSVIDFDLPRGKGLLLLDLKFFRNFMNLQKLELRFPRGCPANYFVDFCADALFKLNELRSLSLDLRNCAQDVIGSIEVFVHTIPYSKNLQYLKMNFPTYILQETVEPILYGVSQNIGGLRSIILDFSNCVNLEFSLISVPITRLASKITEKIEHFEIIVNRKFEQRNPQFDFSLVTTGGLTKVEQDINLNFSKSETISRESLEALYRSSFVKSLTLDFSTCEAVDDDSIEKLGPIFSANLRNLQSLQVFFKKSTKITNHTLLTFGSKILPQLNQLRRLSLGFSSCYCITDDGLNILKLKGIANLPRLQELNLDFSNIGVTDLFLETFAPFLIGNAPSLNKFGLFLNGCREITDKGFKSLVLCIQQNLTKLQYLELSFIWCRNLTDESFKALIPAESKYSKSLTYLKLNFSWCINLSSEVLRILSTNLCKNLPQLRELGLVFEGCAKLIDESLLQMARVLQTSLTSLQVLELNLMTCKISSSTRASLEHILRSVPNLTIII